MPAVLPPYPPVHSVGSGEALGVQVHPDVCVLFDHSVACHALRGARLGLRHEAGWRGEGLSLRSAVLNSGVLSPAVMPALHPNMHAACHPPQLAHAVAEALQGRLAPRQDGGPLVWRHCIQDCGRQGGGHGAAVHGAEAQQQLGCTLQGEGGAWREEERRVRPSSAVAS